MIKKEANAIDRDVNGAAIATFRMIENANYLSTETAENTIYEVVGSSDNISHWSTEAPISKSQVPISSLYLEPLQASTKFDSIDSHYFEASISKSQVPISSLYLEPLQASTKFDSIDSHYFEFSNSIADGYTTVCDEEDSYGFPTNV